MKYKFVLASSFVFVAVIIAAATGCTRSTASQSNNTLTVAPTPKPDATAPKSDQTAIVASSDDVFDGKEIVKTDEEWKKQLSSDAYYVLREEGTDPAFRSQYHDNHEEGEYYCAACHLKLFSSKTKFDSGTGWPSFYQPINAKNVIEKTDKSFGSVRTAIECARCHGHLGHVFDDGPRPTGLRYCMNGTALTFEKK